MNHYAIAHIFPGWIKIAGSPWFFIGVGILLLVFLLLILVIFLRKRKKPTKPLTPLENESGQIDYDEILQSIKKKNGQLLGLLLAASSLHDLPVTVPVNVGVRLAQTHKCLLVDLDIRRNSLARVFELVSTDTDTSLKVSSHPTQFKNLYVWPAQNFEILKQMNLRILLESAVKKYDYVLIYAPYLTTLPDRRQIATCAKQAITFSKSNDSQLMKLLNICHCKVIAEF